MPKFSQLAPTVTDHVEVAGQTVVVTFTKIRDTPELQNSVYSLNIGEQWARYLSETLVKWDVTDDDGAMWPIDVESLRKLPTDLLRIVGRFIVDHDLGKDSSPNGSAPTGSTVPVLAGIPDSGQPGT